MLFARSIHIGLAIDIGIITYTDTDAGLVSADVPPKQIQPANKPLTAARLEGHARAAHVRRGPGAGAPDPITAGLPVRTPNTRRFGRGRAGRGRAGRAQHGLHTL